jgi:hypothetical protein
LGRDSLFTSDRPSACFDLVVDLIAVVGDVETALFAVDHDELAVVIKDYCPACESRKSEKLI